MTTPPREPEGIPPGTPWYHRYWDYYNRPYPGCGCLITILLFVLAWWLFSVQIP